MRRSEGLDPPVATLSCAGLHPTRIGRTTPIDVRIAANLGNI